MQSYTVFTYICTSIGESLDAYRFDTDDNNDLHEAVCKYNNFKNSIDKLNLEPFKTYFEIDPKFKAIPIKEFISNKSWIIENWWTDEEKIEIGLKKAKEKTTVEDFQNLIDETIELMINFRGELECLK